MSKWMRKIEGNLDRSSKSWFQNVDNTTNCKKFKKNSTNPSKHIKMDIKDFIEST